MYSSDIPRNTLQSCLMFHSNLDLLLKTSFEQSFAHPFKLLYHISLVKNSIHRNMNMIDFVYQNKNRNESATLASK